MADVLSRCVLLKGLSADAKEQELKTCLDNRSLEVLKVHSHIESQTDKRWIILLHDSKAAKECIKQGSWRVSLSSGEITVTPDYCSKCIVPNDWTQEEEDSYEESSHESWIKVESNEQSFVTPIHVADGQTADFDAQERFFQLAAEVDTVNNLTEEIIPHTKFPRDKPLSEKLKPKDADGRKGDRTNLDCDETFQDSYFQEISPYSELFIHQSPNMINQSTDYTPLKSGSIPISINKMKKHTVDQRQYSSRENLAKDSDPDSIQMKTTCEKKGTINLTAKRSPWSSLVDPRVKEKDFKRDGDTQRKSGSGHKKMHLPPIPSKEEFGSDEDEESQTEVCHNQHHLSSDLEDCDYTMSDLDIKDDYISSQPLKENYINETPVVAWSHEDPPVHDERPLSPVKTPSPSGGLKQRMQFPLPDVKAEATKIEVHKPSTGISTQTITKPKLQQITGGYSPDMTMAQPTPENMTMPTPNKEIPQQTQGMPSQNIIVLAPNMEMPLLYAEVSSHRLEMPQPNIDTQIPIMGIPQPVTGVPLQNMNVPPMTNLQLNSPFILGQLNSAVAQGHGNTHVMTGQLNPFPGTNSTIVPPGHLHNIGISQPVTEVSLQRMNVPAMTFLKVNSPFIPGQVNSSAAPWHGTAHVMPGQVNSSGGTGISMVPPGYTGSYPYYPRQTIPFIPPGGYPMNYGPYPVGPYGTTHPPPLPTVQPSPTTSLLPTCPPPPQASLPYMRSSVGHQPPQRGLFGLERPGDIAEQKLAVSGTGPVEENGGYVNKIGIPQSQQMVESPPSKDSNESFLSMDCKGYARIKDTDDNSATEEVEIKGLRSQKDDESPKMIKVKGLTTSVSQEVLEMFFESKRKCGGGEIESLEQGRRKGEVFITFKDPSVVQNVLEKQKEESFYLEKMELTVEEYVPPPPDPNRLFLTNLSVRVTQECLLHYLEPRCKATPTEVLFGRLQGTALVTFSEPPDVGLLLKKVKEKSLEGQYIQVIRIPIPRSVQLTGLPLSTSRDTVVLYFENKKRSGGGPVADVEFGREKQSCVVSFENAEDAERVCMRSHTIDKKDIQVCLYFECLDDDLDTDEFSDLTHGTEDTVGELRLPDPVELKDFNPQILRFLLNNEKHRQTFENKLSDVNGIAKWPSSVEDCVIIECTVKMEDESASSVLMDWSIRVVDKVNSFTAGIEVVKFNPIKMTWTGVIERLKTVTIENPEDLGVFLEQEKYNIIVAGPKAAVEKLKKTILDIMAKVETLIELENQSVTETKQMKTYEMILLRATHFKQDIEKAYSGLQFDVNQREKNVSFVGQADIVQKAMVKMHEKLQSFVSTSMPMSKAAKDLLFVKEITDYINQKMKSQKIIGIWDGFRKNEIRMFGRDEREVQKAIQLIKSCLVEKEISLDDVMVQNVKGQQWLQLVERIQEKHSRKVAIKTSMTSILVVAVDNIFQDVFDEINSYLDKHSIQEVFCALEPVRVKFIKRYKNEDIKALEKRFERSHVKLFIIDYGDQKGIKINGTKDGCEAVKSELAKIARNVITREHVMVSRVEFEEFLQSFRGRDQLCSIELKFKCIIVMKDSSASSSLQLEGASGGYSSGSEDDSGQSYEPTDRQCSSEGGGVTLDAGGIKVSVVQGELAKQRVDVIVNSTSQNLDLNTGAISKTILKYGGDSIQRECLQQYPNGINPGQVVVTSGGKLSCTNVYHGYLRAYDGGHGNSIELMKSLVFTCLQQADQSGFQTMSFPALGTGNLGFPADEVAKLMVQCIQTYGKKTPKTSLKDITLVVYPTDINIIKAFTTVFGGTKVPSASTQRRVSSSSISIVHGICRCTLPHSVVLEIVQGDITMETTDVIVNSVLSDLNLSQGQVSKAILIAGGISIQQECQGKDSDLKKHGYVVTDSGRLPCKMIIHMAAQDEGQKWEDMIKRVLFKTDQSGCQSISFPALGTGGKGLSPEKIAQAMYSACTEFAKLQPVCLKKIRVVLFQETMLTTFVQAISVHNSGQGESKVSKTPVAGKYFRGGSKQSRLVFNITADSELSLQAAVRKLEGFAKNEFIL